MAKFFRGIDYDTLEEGAELTLIYEHRDVSGDEQNNSREEKTTHTIYAGDDGLYIVDEVTEFDETKTIQRRIITPDILETLKEQNHTDYRYALFTGEVDFSNYEFPSERLVSFEHVIFSGEAKFNDAKFTYRVIFKDATFGNKANFLLAKFSDVVIFVDAIFSGKAEFRYVKFVKGAWFNLVNIKNTLDFDGASIYFININNLKLVDKYATLSLMSASIDRIVLDKLTLFAHNGANRETFNVLKNLALKQNDQIKALDFHTLEMERYYLDLQSEKGRITEKIILWFEKNVSYFGTDYIRPFMIYLIWAYISYSFILNFSGQWACAESFITYLSPVSYDLVKVFGKSYTTSLGVGLFFLIYKITQFVLIYEIIKSFRMYSRRL